MPYVDDRDFLDDYLKSRVEEIEGELSISEEELEFAENAPWEKELEAFVGALKSETKALKALVKKMESALRKLR
jgi:hypothetical protein